LLRCLLIWPFSTDAAEGDETFLSVRQQAGATFEFRVAKRPGSPQVELIRVNGACMRPKGGKKFADLLWPNRVLIEMKSRGENLEKHYDQAFDYWTHIVPKRPPFVMIDPSWKKRQS
jgi:hypothetical protein